ncbi:beta,beta-carotene 9',10'-oxygenase-like [Asterias rubens]|uniref:beta,beta-carotene 9',10'-oxygenase-like n=1 Tax=Asterias rubens TaxID=7604 RepID=UPI001455D20F|nr:beta,beta-carotene 9',10'-oxygenase-like [Asterias rubens]
MVFIQIDIMKYVAVNSATAHPHYGEDGVVYNMGSSFGFRSNYNIIKMVKAKKGDNANPFEKATVLCSIPASTCNPAYFHSFALTKNYVVFLEQPFNVNVLKILTCKLREVAMSSSLEFHPDEKCRFHIVNIHTGHLITTKYLADSFFCFHFINAYEDQGHVVVDLCSYNDDTIIKYATLESTRSGSASSLEGSLRPVRFVLPLILDGNSDKLVTLADSLATAKLVGKDTVMCTPEVLCEEGTFELPQINYDGYNGRPYRYAYGVVTHHLRQISKIDIKTKSRVLWGSESGSCYPSEPVFVPNPNGVDEDDGVVLSLVTDVSPPAKSTFLVVLDGKTLEEVARAEVKDLPFGIHGMFVNGFNST